MGLDRHILRSALAAATWLLVLLACAAQAHALPLTGGVGYQAASNTGGVQPNAPVDKAPKKKSKKKRRKTPRPVITGSKLSTTTLLDDGRPLTLRYRVKSRASRVRVQLVVRNGGGGYIKTLQLGVHRTKVLQTTKLTQAELGVSSAGKYKLRLVATDAKGRRAGRAAGVHSWLEFSLSEHRFPVAGPFSFGGDGARFGAGRPGHTHQGQDVVADEGTTLVAPHAGTISWVKYQAAGAGYYVVLHSSDGRDYVFMHLQKGSTAVTQGQAVKTGQVLGRVGATGDASGPHLHFEVWVDGPWQFGGHAIDPLPLLKSWYDSAPGGAVKTAAAASALPLDNQ
ncbi:MAG: M23 family metallopeptidase [Solirubrobacterales bacterium]